MLDNSVDLARLKQKISAGVPQHNSKPNKSKTQIFDIENDLINILEDHYQSGTQKSRECESNKDIDCINQESINVNNYLKSIASITYEESYESYINCMVLKH